MNLLDDDSDSQPLDLLNLQQEINRVPNIDFYNTIVVNEFMNNRVVEVLNGEVVKEGYITKYKLYVVKTKGKGGDSEVSRRFSDFEWLYQELINKYGGYIIPSLPEKHLLTKVNLASYEFSERRRKDLQQFLQRILQHPQLRYVPELRIFIEDKEKFISLLKGELEQNKTIEQKYDNLVSSVKTFFSWQGSNIVHKAQEISKLFDGTEKDLNSDETILISLSIKCQRLKNIIEEFILSVNDELKCLNEQNDSLYQWNGLGSANEEDLSQFQILKVMNEKRQKKINRMVEEIDRQLIPRLITNLNEIEWALLACKRKRNLQLQLVVDQQRIEQIKLQYTDNSSRRDLEMDILKTKYQKNKDRCDKMQIIMNEEVSKFVSDIKLQMKDLVEKWKQLMHNFAQPLIEQE